MAARCRDPVPGSTPASQATAALVRAGSRLSESDAGRGAGPGHASCLPGQPRLSRNRAGSADTGTGATRHPDASGADVTRAQAASGHPGTPGRGDHGRVRAGDYFDRMTGPDAFRLTQYARGGGCACKIPPGELEETVGRLMPDGPGTDLMVGVEHGDDGAVVRVSPALAVVVTADFFTPVVDDAYTFGRIAATNALSDIYAMGGEPLVALNLLGWPRDKLPASLAAEVLRGGLDVGRAAQCHVAGGHSIDDPEPKYGMAVAGTADPAALLRIDAGQPGLPLSLTKPIGTGVLNAWHKATGQVSAAAIEVMTTLNADASRRALAAGIRCATDVTGFGLLGHLFKLARASGVSAVVDRAAVPLIDGTRAATRAGYIPGGSRRNLDWVLPHADVGAVGEDDLLLLADAQTSGGLLVAGELPGAPIIGELVPRRDSVLIIR